MCGATLQQCMSEETWDSLHSMWKLRPSGRVAKIKFKTEVPPISCQPVQVNPFWIAHPPVQRHTYYHPHHGHGPQVPELGEPLNQVTENRTATFHVTAANDLLSFPFKSQFLIVCQQIQMLLLLCPQEAGLNLELSGGKKSQNQYCSKNSCRVGLSLTSFPTISY